MSAQSERDGPEQTGDAQSQFLTDKRDRDWYAIWNRGESESYVAVREDGPLPHNLEECR